jgi:uncharacterized protein (DUF362 family)
MHNILYKLESFLKRQVSRGTFLKICWGGIAFVVSQNAFLKLAFAKSAEGGPRTKKNIKGLHDLAVSEGDDPYQNTVKAVDALGGMARFVKAGDVVAVKPNMGWDRSPEQAGNTNPAVVAALVDMAFKAGAKRVDVFDVPCNDEKRVHENSGIAQAAKEKGANVSFVNHWNVIKAKFPYESPMEGWPILRDAMDCNVLINVPVVKHHCLTGLTLSMKNLMGVCSGNRGLMHVDIGRKLVDLTDLMSPELTVIDATRVLLRNGPSGGNLDDVEAMNKVIAGTDPVLADTFAATLMKVDPMSIPYIKVASEMRFGSTDITKADIVKV